MAIGSEVLEMLIPQGGWYIAGDDYSTIKFIHCDPITEKQFLDGFAKYDAWKAIQETNKAKQKTDLLAKLGISQEEAALLLA